MSSKPITFVYVFFYCRRQEPNEFLKSYAKEAANDPIFGKLNPTVLLNHLLKSSSSATGNYIR